MTMALTPPIAVAPTPALVDLFLEGRSPQTLRAYRQDLNAFATWLGADDLDTAARTLLDAGPGHANGVVLAYRNALRDRGLAPATVNRRLAALRSVVGLARTLGLVGWALDVSGLPVEAYRDTRGPGLVGVRELLARAQARTDRKGQRDYAILRLLFDLGLRRGEVATLDLEDLDLAAGTLAVLGKGRSGKVPFSLPEPTRDALRAWIGVRGQEPGPLFVNSDRARKGARLTGTSIWRIVRALGLETGRLVRPHGLRHTAVTVALEVTGGNLSHVQRFSRHKDVRTVLVYNDAREDRGGEVARRVAAMV